MGREHTILDDSHFQEVGLTRAVNALFEEEADDWVAEFDRYEVGGENGLSHSNLEDTESAVQTLTYTAGYPNEHPPSGPESVPEHEAPFTLMDANCERGNNGPFYLDEQGGRIAVELELGMAYENDEGEVENERGSLILKPEYDRST